MRENSATSPAEVQSWESDSFETTPSRPINVVFVVELGLLRHALMGVLSWQADVEVVAAVADPAVVPDISRRALPDVIVVDAEASGIGERLAIHDLRVRLPRAPVIALVTRRSVGLVRCLLEEDGVSVVDKNTSASRLLDALRAVAAGAQFVEPALAVAALGTAPNPLTSREQEILRLAAQGVTATDMAGTLHLSYGTVRNYLSKAITKTGARSRIDAVRIARDSGWL